MVTSKKLLIIVVTLVLVISILSLLPVSSIKHFLKSKKVALEKFRLYLEDIFHIPITFGLVQNLLHIPFFGLLTFLVVFYFNNKFEYLHSVIMTFFIVAGISVFSEFIQLFIGGRDASFGDLVLNGIGYVLGISTHKLSFKHKF